MTDLVGQGLAVSDMPLTNYEDGLLIPAVDLTQDPGSQNVALLASALSTATGVRSFNGRTGTVTLQLSDVNTFIQNAIAAAFTPAQFAIYLAAFQASLPTNPNVAGVGNYINAGGIIQQVQP